MMQPDSRLKRSVRRGALLALVFAASALTGCSTVREWIGGKDNSDKPAELVNFKQSAEARLRWSASIGSSGEFELPPALSGDSVFAAGSDGQLARFDAASGRQIWRIDTGRKLSGGVGASPSMLLVGTPKGEVLAYSHDGQPLWQARVSSEVLSAPQISGSIVVVRAGDGRLFGLDALDGKRKWVYQRAMPLLTVRSFAGVVIDRNAVFAGFAGGKLAALQLENGNIGWEASVAVPRGATELERIADITSLPVVDGRYIYAVAYQGRIACLDITNGNPVWAREISSVAGLALDNRNVYVSDAHGAVHALDKSSGASVWKQDKLFGRQLSAPFVYRGYIAVGDLQGYVHFLAREDGSFAARIATDGSPAQQPMALDDGLLVKTSNGGLFALTVQ